VGEGEREQKELEEGASFSPRSVVLTAKDAPWPEVRYRYVGALTPLPRT